MDSEITVPKLLEVGLDSEDIIGYHGTSIGAVLDLHKTGSLPNGGRHPGQLYFYPPRGDRDFAVQGAEGYAEWNARKHYILPHIPFEPTHDDMEALTSYCMLDIFGKLKPKDYKTDPESLPAFIQKCEENGLDELTLNRLLRDVKKQRRRGVVLTLSNKLGEDFEIKMDEINRNERYIDVPNGLPIEYITGVEPVGQYEWDTLSALK